MPNEHEISMLRAARGAGITSREEMANFMAQMSHESTGFTRLEESFRYTQGVHQIPVRSAWREGEHVVIEVQANAFLHHMVRNFVGSLLPVGRGEKPEAWVGELLAGRDRAVAGPTAPSNGLVFLGPRYPREWGLPDEVCLPA